MVKLLPFLHVPSSEGILVNARSFQWEGIGPTPPPSPPLPLPFPSSLPPPLSAPSTRWRLIPVAVLGYIFIILTGPPVPVKFPWNLQIQKFEGLKKYFTHHDQKISFDWGILDYVVENQQNPSCFF